MGKSRFPITFSVVIPAYNEELGIERCLKSVLLQSVYAKEIIVINDGSTDGTSKILKDFKNLVTIINLEKNTGNKALAMREAIPYLRGEVVVYTDADSVLHPRAIERLLVHFLNPKVGGVSGYVRSKKHNVITGIRELQYILGQEVHKKGMAALKAISVIPGSIGAVRRELFNPSPDTIAEDMDQTLQIIKKGYDVAYETNSIAWTPDPPNIKSYIKQSIRWFSGYFQNLKKHFSYLPLRMKIEIIILGVDNTFSSLVLIASFMELMLGTVLPLYLLLSELAFSLLISLYAMFKRGRKDLFKSALLMPFFRIIDCIIWMYCLLKSLILGKDDMTWHRSDRI